MNMSGIVKRHPLLSLFVLAFTIGGGITLVVLSGLAPPEAMFLAAPSASLAGIALTAIADGKAGLRRLFGALLVWRTGVQWWAFALLFLVPATLVGAMAYGIFGGPGVDWSKLDQLYLALPGLVLLIIFAGFSEEFGWRGFLLRRLQSRHSALVASVITGVAWGLWHVPMFFMEIKGLPYNAMRIELGFVTAIAGFVVYLIAWSVQYTWVYNNTNGSLLLMFVLHGSQFWVGYLVGVDDPRFFVLGLTPVMAVTSVIIVIVSGQKNLSRRHERLTLDATS